MNKNNLKYKRCFMSNIYITDEILKAIKDTINEDFNGNNTAFAEKAKMNNTVITRYKTQAIKNISDHKWQHIYPLIKGKLKPDTQQKLYPKNPSHEIPIEYRQFIKMLQAIPDKEERENLIEHLSDIVLESISSKI